MVMPAIPFQATRIPPLDAPHETYVDAALNMKQNTCSFDVSGHPALTIGCAKIDGLPTGLMLVGKHFDQPSLIRAAEAFEKAIEWQKR